MTVKHYKGAIESPLNDAEALAFKTHIEDMKSVMLDRGFAQEAVDSLTFELKAWTLTISPEEGRSGAFHTKANGERFYALTVSAPGSMFTMQSPQEGASYLSVPAKDQALLLGFELGMNLFNNMGHVLEVMYPGKYDRNAAGGSGGPVGIMEMETTFRADIDDYMTGLKTVLGMRLVNVAPRVQNQTPPAPKKPGGPRP